jgi:hypothetical protein
MATKVDLKTDIGPLNFDASDLHAIEASSENCWETASPFIRWRSSNSSLAHFLWPIVPEVNSINPMHLVCFLKNFSLVDWWNIHDSWWWVEGTTKIERGNPLPEISIEQVLNHFITHEEQYDQAFQGLQHESDMLHMPDIYHSVLTSLVVILPKMQTMSFT